MKTVGDRIRARREELKLSQEELAKKLGYKSRSSINKIEIGCQNLKQSKIKAIADALDTTPSYIMGWEEEAGIFSFPNIEPLPPMKKIPLIGTIACGEPIWAEENIEEYIDIGEYVKADFCLRCKGDSMINARIHDGDIVCIRQQPMVENNEIAAVIIDGEATLKRFTRQGDIIVLKSENPDFHDIIISADDFKDVRVIGKATHFISKLK